ncbi:hypothetical protein H8356DRAFT_1075780 [Neocallimastix lanati (nom. inval.)]|nr:hypothetical protein H8356DRAFT_1075780 [Neocallimastix sp. JGI-2020a]
MKIKNIIQLKRRNNHKKKLKELLFLGDEFDIDNEYIRGHYYDFMINYKENEQYSTCGEFGKNPKWEMLIYNGGFLENFLSLVLTSSNINRFFFLDIFCLKFAVSISNKDYSNYYTKKKYIYSVKSLLNENKITINYEKNENEEKGKNKDNEDNEDSEDNENNEDNEDENDKDLYTVEDEDYYEFPIENINELSEDIFFSDNLYNGNYSWTLMVYPNGKDTDGNDYISIYLKSYDVIDLDYYHVCCNFIVTLRNYNNYSIYKAKAIPNDCYFSLNNNEYGFKYIKKELLTTKDAIFNRSILENDKIVIGIYMRILKYNSKG